MDSKRFLMPIFQNNKREKREYINIPHIPVQIIFKNF